MGLVANIEDEPDCEVWPARRGTLDVGSAYKGGPNDGGAHNGNSLESLFIFISIYHII